MFHGGPFSSGDGAGNKPAASSRVAIRAPSDRIIRSTEQAQRGRDFSGILDLVQNRRPTEQARRRRCATSKPSVWPGVNPTPQIVFVLPPCTPQICGTSATAPCQGRNEDNPPGLDGTPAFCKAHVKEQLIKSRSATRRHLLHRLWWDLKETDAELANGRKVFNRNDAVVWLIEQFEERG